MKRSLLALAVLLVAPAAFGQTFQYSESFTQGATFCPGSPQYDNWLSFRASLPASGVTSVRISGSQDPTGLTCSDPGIPQQIADALRLQSTFNVSCGANTWQVSGGCQQGGSCGLPNNDVILAVNAGGTCNCDSVAYVVRPGIANINWGGINGPTCSAATQTMTVTVVAAAVPVPALPSLAMAALVLALLVAGALALRRRSRIASA